MLPRLRGVEICRVTQPYADDQSLTRCVARDAVHGRWLQPSQLGEELPLIRMGNHLVIDEDGIAHLARAVLERERDEVPEPAVREGVLVGEESIV